MAVRDTGELIDAWRQLSAQGVNNRAAAARLGMTEADLIDSACGAFAIRLKPDARALLQAARGLGRIKAVVRNDYAVIERSGEISEIAGHGYQRLRATSGAFDLRIDANQVVRAYALTETGRHGVKRSFQLFDREGLSVAKLILRPESKLDAFAELVEALKQPDPSSSAPSSSTSRDSSVNVLDNDKAAPAAHVHQRTSESTPSLAAFLRHAAAIAIPLHVTVRNAGASLAAVTRFRRIKRSDRAPWINVLDPDLDLHLFEAQIGRLDPEPALGDAGRFHWRTREGLEAFSAETSTAFRELMTAALPPNPDIPQPSAAGAQ